MLFQGHAKEVARLLISSFVYLNVHAATIVASEYEIMVRPGRSTFGDGPIDRPDQTAHMLKNFVERARAVAATKDVEEREARERALQQFVALTSVAWTVSVMKHVADGTQLLLKKVFTPFIEMTKLLAEEGARLDEYLNNPLMLSEALNKNLVESANFDGWSADISWNGRIKLTQTADSSSTVRVQSLTDVILDNVAAENVSISAPRVALRGDANIKNLAVDFYDETLPDVPTNFANSGVFEITSSANLTTQNFKMNGLLWNKGTIDLTAPAKIELNSFVNAGIVKTEGRLDLDAKTLLQNSGTIECTDLYLKANVIRQASLNNSDPIIRGDKVHLVAMEQMLIQDGTISSNESELTTLGSFENYANIKSKRLKVAAEGASHNSGCFQVEHADLTLNGSFENRGVISATTEEGFINLTMASNTAFEQFGVLQTNTLKLEGQGRNLTFRNHNKLSAALFGLNNFATFENISPLTFEERGGQATPSTGANIGELKNGVISNTGFLCVNKAWDVSELRNYGLLQSTNILCANKLTQEGTLTATHLFLSDKCTNTGTLMANWIDGSGSFVQSGKLLSNNRLSISLKNFEQK
jgi:hypothetical protein